MAAAQTRMSQTSFREDLVRPTISAEYELDNEVGIDQFLLVDKLWYDRGSRFRSNAAPPILIEEQEHDVEERAQSERSWTAAGFVLPICRAIHTHERIGEERSYSVRDRGTECHAWRLVLTHTESRCRQ